MDIDDLISEVRKAAFEVRLNLAPGYKEEVYRRALHHELMLRGFRVEMEKHLSVEYKGLIVGEYRADLFVEDCLIIELKAIQKLEVAHSVQLVNYLSCAHQEKGCLINYGGQTFEFKTKVREYKKETH